MFDKWTVFRIQNQNFKEFYLNILLSKNICFLLEI